MQIYIVSDKKYLLFVLCYINHEYILCINPIFEYNKYIST